MSTALRSKNDLDVLQVRLWPFSFTRLIPMGLSTSSLRRLVGNVG